ncbi:MAG: prolipoprotein diacylglyceryl transferase [bacterium]|nr:prolipoprotein diacylglyceryl transferase [bacterium]
MPSWYLTQFHLGPIPINIWGLFVAVGFLTATWLAVRLAPRYGMDPEHVLRVAMWAIVAGIIGARLGHVVFYEPAYYLAHPIDVLKVWEGGLSSFGGFLGAVIAVIIMLRVRPRQGTRSLLAWSDLLLLPLALGWCIGRIGCFSIHDHAGIPCDGFLCVPFPDGTRRLDMGLLDGLLALTIFAVAWLLRRRLHARPGTTTAFIVGCYGIGRFLLDFLRVSDTTYLGLTPAQYGSMVLVGVAVATMVRRTR